MKTLFCTANDSTAESVNSHKVLEFTVTDAKRANLTLSPPQPLAQLTVIAESHEAVTKAKGGEKDKHNFLYSTVQT